MTVDDGNTVHTSACEASRSVKREQQKVYTCLNEGPSGNARCRCWVGPLFSLIHAISFISTTPFGRERAKLTGNNEDFSLSQHKAFGAAGFRISVPTTN